MSLLDTPEARSLLAEADVSAEAVRGCRGRLTRFLRRYLPLFYRKEQRHNAALVIRGLLSDLERKTCEPIAYREGVERKPIQFFVGTGKWDDEAVMAELRRHVVATLADPNGVLVIDPSGFPKKGTESVGVKRQWCGRLGKIENCQVGVYLAYATAEGHGPLDRRLFLPEDWADDPERRAKCHVPDEIEHRKKWQIATDMLERHADTIPHGWVAGDDDFGRSAEFRAWLRKRQERYALDVPCDTLVRDLQARRPRRRRAGRGRKREVSFVRADVWAKQQRPSAWQRFTVRDGEKGPLEVEAIETRVRAKHDGRIGAEERLVVIRSVGPESWTAYVLTNADDKTPLADVVCAHAQRHRIEQLFEEGKGEAGLDHYEVRSWVGWHHHMTLALVALWFLQLEKRRLGEKNTRRDRPTGPPDLLAAAS